MSAPLDCARDRQLGLFDFTPPPMAPAILSSVVTTPTTEAREAVAGTATTSGAASPVSAGQRAWVAANVPIWSKKAELLRAGRMPGAGIGAARVAAALESTIRRLVLDVAGGDLVAALRFWRDGIAERPHPVQPAITLNSGPLMAALRDRLSRELFALEHGA